MFKIIISIWVMFVLIVVIGFFGFVCKEYNNPKKDLYQSQTPVLDKLNKDVEKTLQTRKEG